MSPQRLVIASRESRLAMWQARFVQQQLKAIYPSCNIEILGMTTKGDQILDKTLSKIGGKGLFVKELQTALLEGRADFAVHSLKDVPVEPQPMFKLAAILKRADHRDAFVSNRYASLDGLPAGAVVGTSSLRRESQLRAQYPHLVIKPLRGNLDTRLGKLDQGAYDAIILAAAGLQRLELAHRIVQYLTVEQSLPAAGQGALGIEIASNRADLMPILQVLHDPVDSVLIAAERYVSFALGGSCQVPLAAYAQPMSDTDFMLRAMVSVPDGTQCIRAQSVGRMTDYQLVAQRVTDELLAQGAESLIRLVKV